MMAAGRPGMLAIALWAASMLVCVATVSRTRFTTDLSAFLPRSPTPQQKLLMNQLRDGLASRLILWASKGPMHRHGRGYRSRWRSGCAATAPSSP
jgi:predicted exporter